MKDILRNEKINIVLKILLVIGGLYLGVKYVFPLVWPIIAGYLIAIIIKPWTEFIKRRVKLKESVVIAGCLLLFVSLFLIVSFLIGRGFVIQTRNLVSNWEYISRDVSDEARAICRRIEENARIEKGALFKVLERGVDSGIDAGKAKIMSLLMNNSMSVFVKAIEVFVGIIVAVISAFLFLHTREQIKEKFKEFPFAEEMRRVIEKAKFIFKAYIKAQLVIMLVSIVICFVGLTIIGNPYSMILALVVGILDALPFLGGGVILVPWGIYFLISGQMKNGIVLLLVFVLCYILREVLEPRLVGNKIGISPLLSLATMYAGFRLVGIIGAVLGPLSVVVVKECLRCDLDTDEPVEKEV